MKIFKFFLLLLCFILLFSVSCKKGRGGVEFIQWNESEPESLDSHLISGIPEHRIQMALSEGLIIYDPKTAEGIPGLAKSWEISNDGKTYTFKLRKATWSDGVPITAQTFVDSWLRMLNPETAAPYAWFPSMFIAGAGDYNNGKAGPESVKIKAIDDYTFEINLVGPLPYVIGALAHYSFNPVPLHAIEKHGKEWTDPKNFVGNGPFILESWEPQERLTCVPNPKYWDKGAVKLDRVTFLPIDDNNTGYNLYINEESDQAPNVPLDQMDSARLRDDYHNAPRLGCYYYVIQNQKPPFNNPKVRKALAMSIDRQTLVDKITRRGELPAYSMVPPMAGYTPASGNKEDIAKAKQLLADAGFPNGKGFPKFQILYNTHEGHKKIAEFIQQQWEENLGIQCELINQEWKTYLATRRQGDFQVARAGWIGDYMDPNTFLDMFVTGGAMNGGKYSNPKYDELINKAATMPSGKKRFDILKEAEEIFITEDQGVIPIYYYTSNNMVDTDKWGGWHKNTMDYHPYKDIYLK